MPTREDIVLLAAYNASMNRKLYAAAAQLPESELAADRKAFFGSLLGTLNHIMSGDTIWLRRFMAHPAGFRALEAMREIPESTGLTHQFGADLPSLLAIRNRLDEMITALAAELSTADLALPVAYRNALGAHCTPFGSLLLHFFNHQTHHRGQASTLLSQAGVDIGVTDLLVLIKD
jgi:uncharacterized damage-inducible protein DinB